MKIPALLVVISSAFLTLFMIPARGEASCSGNGKVWTCSEGSSAVDVQDAVNKATDGATIQFESGEYVWARVIYLSPQKGVTLRGAGIDASTVTVHTTQLITLSYSGDNDKFYRITGFTFQNAPAAALSIIFFGNGTLSNVRIDHNKFTEFHTKAIAIHFGELTRINKTHALVDHNIFTGRTNFIGLKYLGPGDPSQWMSSVKGTDQNVFLENNLFDFTTSTVESLAKSCVDSWRAGAVVFRYNTVKNCLVAAHGVTHGTTVNMEVYRNTLERTAGSGGNWENGHRLFHHQGSGEILVWDNVVKVPKPISSAALSITHYRSADPAVAGYSAELGRCDGTQSKDWNTRGSGTACWMQPGRAPAGGRPIYGVLSPVYAWQNIDIRTGAKVPIAIENPWGAISPDVSDHIKPNRDYYDSVSNTQQTSPTSPFNGTMGVGFGTLALRPSTCTTNVEEDGGGVAYFATNQGPQGTLYRCSAPNTWTIHYTPYTYPHPLQTNDSREIWSPPSSPKSLSVH